MRTGDFWAGVRAMTPVLVGVAPFGLVAGIAAIDTGFTPVQAMGLSVIVFAGAAQLAALDLLARDAPLVVVVVTAAIINLRLVMYSASIAPYFRSFTTRWKAGLAYLLTDQAFALSLAEYERDSTTSRRWFYVGAALSLWVVWQVGTVAGIALGQGVPEAWGLSFTIPLVFLALLVFAVEDRPSLLAAVVGGGVAVVGAGLPMNLGLVVGALAGVVAALLVDGEWS